MLVIGFAARGSEADWPKMGVGEQQRSADARINPGCRLICLVGISLVVRQECRRGGRRPRKPVWPYVLISGRRAHRDRLGRRSDRFVPAPSPANGFAALRWLPRRWRPCVRRWPSASAGSGWKSVRPPTLPPFRARPDAGARAGTRNRHGFAGRGFQEHDKIGSAAEKAQRMVSRQKGPLARGQTKRRDCSRLYVARSG